MKGVRQMEEKERQHDEKGGWEDSAVAFLMLPMLQSRFKPCPSPVFLPASLPSYLPVEQRQRGSERSRDERGDAGAARGKSVGHRRSKLKVT